MGENATAFALTKPDEEDYEAAVWWLPRSKSPPDPATAPPRPSPVGFLSGFDNKIRRHSMEVSLCRLGLADWLAAWPGSAAS